MKKMLVLPFLLPLTVFAQTQGFNTFVNGLSAAGTLAGTENIPTVQSGSTTKATPAQIAAYTNSQLPSLWSCAANRVVYDNSSGSITCSANLTYSGANLTVATGWLGLGTVPNCTDNFRLQSGGGCAPNGGLIELANTAPAANYNAIIAKDVTGIDGGAIGLFGASSTGGNAGSVDIYAGAARSGNFNGGQVGVLGGNGFGLGSGGTVTIGGGNGGASSTGQPAIFSIGGATNTTAGALTFNAGNATAATNAAIVSVNGGNNFTGAGSGGGIQFTAGTGASGGGITFTGGAATTVTGGSVTIQAGAGLTLPTSGTVALQDANGANNILIDASGNVQLGGDNTQAPADTDGFVGLSTVAGIPTGVPAHPATGIAYCRYDTGNSTLYCYNTSWKPVAGTLVGTTISLGGGALTAGSCASNTTTITGAATNMVAIADPNNYPGDGAVWSAQVTAANTVTTRVCAIIALTPAPSTYNLRVTP